jgi:hypothetical protein
MLAYEKSAANIKEANENSMRKLSFTVRARRTTLAERLECTRK